MTFRASVLLALAAPVLVAVAVPAMADDVQYELVNQTGLTVMEFYTSPASQEQWGDDILGAQVIAAGDSGTVTIADGSDQCSYDLLFVFEDGQEFQDSANVCDMASYTLTQE